MARKLPRLQRVLDAPALFSVAYGEIASSIYFALWIIALHALGLTPAVLLAAGAVFLLVSLSYAEGTAAIPETGGAATFVRRAVNDLAGFMTGWVLFLDYLIVIALSALSVPHYAGAAFGLDGLRENPWDVVTGVGMIAAIATARLLRRSRLYRFALVVAVVDLLTQSLLVVLGFALLFSPDALGAGTDLGVSPSWGDLAFALPLAFLAYTGLETIANLAEEARSPGRDLPRTLFSAIGVVVALYVAIALVGVSAFPAENGQTELAGEWLRAPLMGIVDQLDGPLPGPLAGALQVYVGLTAVLIMVAAATTSMSGFGRLAYSLGEHGMLPTSFGRLHRRTLVSPQSIVLAAIVAAALLVGASVVRPDDEVQSLASLFSFGILLAFTGAQLAVLRLRMVEPNLERPFRARPEVTVRGHLLPLPTLLALPVTAVLWVAALATHAGARVAGPIWLVLGLVLYVVVRKRERQGVLARVEPVKGDLVPEVEGAYRRILVPLKGGAIGDEVLATALRLASEQGADVEVMHVVRVPLDAPLDGGSGEHDAEGELSIDEARELAAEQGVEIHGRVVRARSIGEAIVASARDAEADVILLGSAPRWRRQSRFFSPTVDHVLRHADCEVMVVAYPEGVLEDELES